jgi:hypothetical protein
VKIDRREGSREAEEPLQLRAQEVSPDGDLDLSIRILQTFAEDVAPAGSGLPLVSAFREPIR